jgi:hypothetical protein
MAKQARQVRGKYHPLVHDLVRIGCRQENMAIHNEPNGTWRKLIAKHKQRNAKYRITLLVRGKKIVKVYDNLLDFERWKETYQQQLRYPDSGIEKVIADTVY